MNISKTTNPFSPEAKKKLPVNKEITEKGLIWRKSKDGTGSWRYDFYDNGHRYKGVLGKESHGMTLSQAKNELKVLRAKRTLAPPMSSSGMSSVKFEKVCQEYLEWAKLYRKGYRQLQDRINKKILPELGGMMISDISTRVICDFQSGLVTRDYAYDTVRLCMSAVSAVFNYYQLQYPDAINPVKRVPRIRKDNRDKKIKTISHDEFLRLYSACNGDMKKEVMISLGYYAGLRASEILGLEWKNINFDEERLTVSQSVVDGVLQKTTKSGKTRYVPLSGKLKKILQEYKQKNPETMFVLTSSKTGGHYHHIQKLFAGVKKNLKEKIKYSMHTLRHSFATRAVECGVDLPMLKEWLGHSSITTTMIYVHPDEAHSAEMMLLMN